MQCVQVMQVDIGMYDTDWQDRNPGKESRISTFADLAMELVRPYGSMRPPERLDLTEEETFWALTGEDRYFLKPGKLVTARVIWVKKDLAGLVTDSGTPNALRMCIRSCIVYSHLSPLYRVLNACCKQQ